MLGMCGELEQCGGKGSLSLVAKLKHATVHAHKLHNLIRRPLKWIIIQMTKSKSEILERNEFLVTNLQISLVRTT